MVTGIFRVSCESGSYQSRTTITGESSGSGFQGNGATPKETAVVGQVVIVKDKVDNYMHWPVSNNANCPSRNALQLHDKDHVHVIPAEKKRRIEAIAGSMEVVSEDENVETQHIQNVHFFIDGSWLPSLSGTMSILSWNCRGLGNPKAVPNIKDLVRSSHAEVIFLFETLAYANKIEELKRKINFHR